MSFNIKTHNENVRVASQFDAAAEWIQTPIPDWRNYYSLRYKPSNLEVPMDKLFCMKGGFKTVKSFCEFYCNKKGYMFLTLAPIYSDLEYELTGTAGWHAAETKSISEKNQGEK